MFTEYSEASSIVLVILVVLSFGLNAAFIIKNVRRRELLERKEKEFLEFPVVVARKDKNGNFRLTSPIIPDLILHGKTLEEVMDNLPSALSLTLVHYKNIGKSFRLFWIEGI